jgi:hypothetical protein
MFYCGNTQDILLEIANDGFVKNNLHVDKCLEANNNVLKVSVYIKI